MAMHLRLAPLSLINPLCHFVLGVDIEGTLAINQIILKITFVNYVVAVIKSDALPIPLVGSKFSIVEGLFTLYLIWDSI